MQKVLRPIVHRDEYVRLIEREILAWFRETIFMPLLIELHNADVPIDPMYQAIEFDELGKQNAAATTALQAALKSGRVYYTDGQFSGKFSGAISRELRGLGATFDTRGKVYRLPVDKMPLDLRSLLAENLEKAKTLHETIVNTLTTIEQNLAATADIGLQFNGAMDKIIADLTKQFDTTTDGIEAISVQAQFSEGMKTRMTQELTTNINLSIKDFAQERIPELRALVQKNALEGMRPNELSAIIQAQFGVSKRKADFLADQESGLVVAKYRELRYNEAGVTEYIWQTSHDSRVRADHKLLEGGRFSFSNPPVEDQRTGRRGNPGTGYRCRCVARPIVNFVPTATP